MNREAEAAVDLLGLLQRGGYITASIRDVILRFTEKWPMSPFHALIETAVLSETEIADALATLLNIDRLYNLERLALAEDAAKIIGFERAREFECVILESEGQRLDLVLADPSRRDRIDVLQRELNCELTLAVAERSDIVRAIDELYPLAAQLPSLLES